ncbi:hypothetical protein PG994_004000 [Apiospora phragmitis]|uniref:Uncharacterized protein n=1 Tax=Apiospora phragmitis TaxID=2905665 RepID=A0ABR1W3J8_9PEZI
MAKPARVERADYGSDQPAVHPADEPEVGNGGEQRRGVLADIRLTADVVQRCEVQPSHVPQAPKHIPGPQVDVGQDVLAKVDPHESPSESPYVSGELRAVGEEAEKGALARDQAARAVFVREVGRDDPARQRVVRPRVLLLGKPAAVVAAQVDIPEQKGQGQRAPCAGDEPGASKSPAVAQQTFKDQDHDIGWEAISHICEVRHGWSTWRVYLY